MSLQRKFTFAISSPDEFLVLISLSTNSLKHGCGKLFHLCAALYASLWSLADHIQFIHSTKNWSTFVNKHIIEKVLKSVEKLTIIIAE